MILRRFLILLILLVLGRVQSVADTRDPSSDVPLAPPKHSSPAKPGFTAKEIQAYVQEVAPHVERIMGRKFKSLPQVVVGDSEAVAEVLAGDMEPSIRKENPEYSEAEVAETALVEARDRVPDILGKYGVKAKKLGLMPVNVLETLEDNRIDPKHATGIMKLLIAHELTHALQAQYVDILDILGKQPNEDAAAACNAVIEGQPMFVQDRVGQALHLGAADGEYGRTFSPGNLDFADAECRNAAAYREFIYLAGKRFVEYHYGKGGAESLWTILARPPAATSMISRPETYSTSPLQRPDLSKVFAGPVEGLRKKRWVFQERELGEIHLRSTYAEMPPAKLDALTENLVAARSLSAESPTEGDIQVTLFVVKNREAAAKLLGVLHGLMAQNMKAASENPAYRVKDLIDAKYDDVPGDASRKLHIVLTNETGKKVLEQRLVLVARGTVVVQVLVQHPILKKRLANLIEDILHGAAEAVRVPKA